MNAVYPSIIDACMIGTVDISTDLTCTMVDGYVYSSTHAVLGDITGAFDTPQAVTVDSVTDGELWINGDITFPSVATGNTVTGLVFYIAGPDLLVCSIDRRADTVPLSVDTNDGDITFTFQRLLRL